MINTVDTIEITNIDGTRTIIDNRVLADVQADRCNTVDQFCQEWIGKEATDVQQAKAIQCLQGQTVPGYDTTKATAILATVNQLRQQAQTIKSQIMSATTCDQASNIGWYQ